MRRLMQKLWNDDGGALIAAEWLFIVTIMVIGIVTGLATVRNAVASELVEVANAITTLDPAWLRSRRPAWNTTHTPRSPPARRIFRHR